MRRLRSVRWSFLILSLTFVFATACAPVFRAAVAGDVSLLKRLLAEGKRPDAGRHGLTPLVLAVHQRDVEMAKALVDAGADLRWQFLRGRLGRISLLHLAAITRDADMVTYLLSVGADPFATTSEGASVLAAMVLGNNDPDFEVWSELDTSITNVMLTYVETHAGHESAVAMANARSWNGLTPLAIAAYHGDHVMIEQLIAHGADPSVTSPITFLDEDSSDRWPPLFFADFSGNSGAAAMLRDGGADPEQRTAEGRDYAAVLAQFEEKRQREEEEMRRRHEAEQESERESAMIAGAIMDGFARGFADNPNNPAHDTSEQERYEEMYRQYVAEGAASSSGSGSSSALGDQRSHATLPSLPSVNDDAQQQTPAPDTSVAPSTEAEPTLPQVNAPTDASPTTPQVNAPTEVSPGVRVPATPPKETSAPATKNTKQYLQVAVVHERKKAICTTSRLVRFSTIQTDNYDRARNEFEREIHQSYPFGNKKPYSGMPIIKQIPASRIVVIVAAKKTEDGWDCESDTLSVWMSESDESYDQMLVRIGEHNRKWKLRDWQVIQRWPLQTVGD